jgi:hypothetical protein
MTPTSILFEMVEKKSFFSALEGTYTMSSSFATSRGFKTLARGKAFKQFNGIAAKTYSPGTMLRYAPVMDPLIILILIIPNVKIPFITKHSISTLSTAEV